MPTQLQQLRRSGRNAGKKIATPKYQHDLFQDPPTIRVKKKTVSAPKKRVAKKSLTNEEFVLSEEEEDVEKEVSSVVGQSQSLVQ